MEENQDEKIKALQSKIAVLKAVAVTGRHDCQDRDDLYVKLAVAKQAVQSLHSDIGYVFSTPFPARHIMEFIISKRKDLSFIGPEFSSVLKADEEAKIHVRVRSVNEEQEIEFDYPDIHSIIDKDFEKACENTPGISKMRLRGLPLFKQVCF